MDYWHATIRCDFPDDTVPEELTHVAETLLADHVGHVATARDGRTSTVRLYVVADRAAAAAGKALRVFHRVARDAKWPTLTVTEIHARLHFSDGREVAPVPPREEFAGA